MSTTLARLLRDSRLRALARIVAFAIPCAAVIVAASMRFDAGQWPWALALCVAATGVTAWWLLRRIDTHWLERRLDERDPRMEDSAALLFVDPAEATPLQRLQQSRLHHRLSQAAPPDLRPAWPVRALATCWLLAAVLATTALMWPARTASHAVQAEPANPTAPLARPGHTRISRLQLQVAPPAYTRLPIRSEATFEAKVPEGSQVRWTLHLDPMPAAAALAFHDGLRVPLVREGDDWIATRRIDKPLLYRVLLEDAPPLLADRLYRLDVALDQPPQVKAVSPEDTLTLRRDGQRTWTVTFEAQDDYGLGASAPLRITLAQGEGENIRFEERSLTLAGRGNTTRKRYAHSFDLAALGLVPGSDFVVQLAVTDNRAAGPQTTRSASYILRWPPEDATETTGLDGMVKKALPAYFRSQRQIIIDSEALLAQRRKLDAEQYLGRSDGIGVDQRLLRLRYGQFLGEESEGAPKRSLPIAEEESEAPSRPLLPTADAEDEADAPTEQPHGEAADAHDHAATGQPAAFGEAGDVLSEYGHTHDDAEAATLLDPETRRTLKAALDQMWQAELHLRQGRPDLALPYEYKALDYIKQVQQAGRIYLARVGSELPPIDPARRLSGDRKGLAPRSEPLVAATPASPLLESLWRALETPPGRESPALDLDGAERWLRANERRVPDALGVIAALDGVRNDPACASCRQLLRGRLWPLLRRPPTHPAPRAKPDRTGQAYLDALQAERP
jgi:hypothetical protein